MVSRFAKHQGFRVISNDWEPYAEELNRCHISCNHPPRIPRGETYRQVIDRLNGLPDQADWVSNHLCPKDDDDVDVARERMFYMRKNGLRIDAIREAIAELEQSDGLCADARACLIAPLLFAACYHANTSGVFKGFHRGWGGQTKTALYRIAADLTIGPVRFFDNDRDNRVFRMDAGGLDAAMTAENIQADIAYLDPPYNQHPYGSNYHVLNSIALWDKPILSPTIDGHGSKSAIRTDWRTDRRSAYNHRSEAAEAYQSLLDSMDVRWIATSYSTDGTIPLRDLIIANIARGDVRLFMQPYKRYRVSSQRFSGKPLNVEFVLLTQTGVRSRRSADEIASLILNKEKTELDRHPESNSEDVSLSSAF